MKILSFQRFKHSYQIHVWLDKPFKGTVPKGHLKLLLQSFFTGGNMEIGKKVEDWDKEGNTVEDWDKEGNTVEDWDKEGSKEGDEDKEGNTVEDGDKEGNTVEDWDKEGSKKDGDKEGNI